MGKSREFAQGSIACNRIKSSVFQFITHPLASVILLGMASGVEQKEICLPPSLLLPPLRSLGGGSFQNTSFSRVTQRRASHPHFLGHYAYVTVHNYSLTCGYEYVYLHTIQHDSIDSLYTCPPCDSPWFPVGTKRFSACFGVRQNPCRCADTRD